VIVRKQGNPDLIPSRFGMYDQGSALDYRGNLADLVATGILVSGALIHVILVIVVIVVVIRLVTGRGV